MLRLLVRCFDLLLNVLKPNGISYEENRTRDVRFNTRTVCHRICATLLCILVSTTEILMQFFPPAIRVLKYTFRPTIPEVKSSITGLSFSGIHELSSFKVSTVQTTFYSADHTYCPHTFDFRGKKNI